MPERKSPYRPNGVDLGSFLSPLSFGKVDPAGYMTVLVIVNLRAAGK